jgi:hypothetical protein
MPAPVFLMTISAELQALVNAAVAVVCLALLEH